MQKIKEWLLRYGFAEILGTLGALGGFHLARLGGAGMLLAAYAAAIGENLGFYGTIVTRQVWADSQEAARYDAKAWTRTLLALCVEFGLAEIMDTMLTRPLCISFGAAVAGTGWGVMLGKLLGDCVFYVPVIFIYELRKLRARRTSQLPRERLTA